MVHHVSALEDRVAHRLLLLVERVDSLYEQLPLQVPTAVGSYDTIEDHMVGRHQRQLRAIGGIGALRGARRVGQRVGLLVGNRAGLRHVVR
eukprot:1515335-Rhodomonas_salina.1